MNHSPKTILPVAELANFSFHVPAYQRGYRWSPKDVEALLEDVAGFKPRPVPGSDEKTWYCLQPLVVKYDDERDQYEVIDGQQRLTTIYLIIRCVNTIQRDRQKNPEFSLTYESRQDTGIFLQSLGETDELNDSNIDFDYISKAYQAINQWGWAQSDSDRNAFISKFRHHVKVIWYDAGDTGSVESFTRLNMGKIPLTNAELIKALFLNSSNYQPSGDAAQANERIHLKQLEISREWDRMETALNEPEFWYFLTDAKTERQTRIDLVFELLTQTKEISERDPYAMFREYSSKFRAYTQDEIEAQWREVVRCFQILEEWYGDRDRFHKIGYLITVRLGSLLHELYAQARRMKKSDFMCSLDEQIRQVLPESLDELSYCDTAKVRSVLLLHNIQTMLDNREERSRFPFDRFKDKDAKWDVEHIFSQNEEAPGQARHRREWLKDAQAYVESSSLREDIKTLLQTDLEAEDAFKAIYASILKDFEAGEKAEETNALSNLALLDAGTNRGYGNAVFPVKRATIIERERIGTFVPVCTKNIFMKFYSTEVKCFTFWSADDQEAYFENIVKVLKAYRDYSKEGSDS